MDSVRPERWLPVVGWKDLYEVSNNGRVRSLNRTISRAMHGSKNPNAKLTWNESCEIKILLKEGNLSQQAIANIFNITQSTVFLIKKGKIWKYPEEKIATYEKQGQILQPILNTYADYFIVTLHRDGKQISREIHRLVLEAFVGPCPVGNEACHGPGGPTDNRWPENLEWGTRKKNMNEDKIRDHKTQRGENAGYRKLSYAQRCEIYRLAWEGKLSRRTIAKMFNISYQHVGNIKRKDRWRYPPEEW